MQLSDFDYKLPAHLIAQTPIGPRDSSRLMVLFKDRILHRTFRDLKEYLNPGDVLVLNDSMVIPARLIGKKETGGKVEALLVTRMKNNFWEVLVKGKNIKAGTRLIFGDGGFYGTVLDRIEGGRFQMEFENEGGLAEVIDKIGTMPTPPYIKEELKDQDRYQTVYAKESGSIAAPTAGLHFTKGLLKELKDDGVEIVTITLHVSVGTFLPVKESYISKHRMEPEFYEITDYEAGRINSAKEEKRRVIAVGTTTLKALESACSDDGRIERTKGTSSLFIYPGYDFKFHSDGLLTNFHLPKSTLIMLVSAFAGKDKIFEAYSEAMRQSYRFYSFGDAMLILK